MQKFSFRFPKKYFGFRKMTNFNDAQLLDEMKGYIKVASSPRGLSETKSQTLERVARVLGVDPSRIKNYYYDKVKKVRAIDIENARQRLALSEANSREIKAEIQRLRGLDVSENDNSDVGVSYDDR